MKEYTIIGEEAGGNGTLSYGARATEKSGTLEK